MSCTEIKFVDSNGDTVGSELSISVAGISVSGRAFYTIYNYSTNQVYTYPSTGGVNTSRDTRVASFHLSEFGITASNYADIVGMVHTLTGDSDQAFLAYNKGSFRVAATDLAVSGYPSYSCSDGNVTFTVTVSNTGDNDAGSFAVTTPLPAGYTLVSTNDAALTTASYDATTQRWQIDSLADGDSITLTLTATPTDPTTDATLTASIINMLNTDTATGNNSFAITKYGEIDSDDDGVYNSCDLDDDNDGILDTDETLYCDQSTEPIATLGQAYSTTSVGNYKNQMLPFDFSGVSVAAGATANVTRIYNGVTYTATISNVDYSGANNSSSSYAETVTGANNNALVRYYSGYSSGDSLFVRPYEGTASYNITFKAVKNGVTLPVTVAVWEAQITQSPVESTVLTTNGSNFSLLESVDASGVTSPDLTDKITGDGTHTVSYLETRLPAGAQVNAVFTTSSTGELTITNSSTSNNGAQQKTGYAIRLYCDTDSDGTPNFLDLDSDGDGCTDALEANSTLDYSDLNADGSINATVDSDSNSATYGVPGSSAAAGTGTSQDATTQAAECDSCNSSSSLFVDSDGDGVGNACDLDDDNDGILDTDENLSACTSTVSTTLFTEDFGTGTTVTSNGEVVSLTYTETGYITDGHYSVRNTTADTQWSPWVVQSEDRTTGDTDGRMLIVNHGTTAGSFYKKLLEVRANQTITVAAYVMNLTESGHNWAKPQISFTLYDTQGNEITTSASTEIENDEDWHLVSAELEPGDNSTVYIAINDEQKTTAANDFLLDDITVTQVACDTDGDGTPNYLDLDSDNDGCLDAIEGGASFSTSDLTNATGVTVGTGSSAANQNLGNTVGNTTTTMGIPTVAGTGQTVGGSQVAAQMSITAQPSDQTVNVGGTANFNVTTSSTETTTFNNGTPDYASGTSPASGVTYSWYQRTSSSAAWGTTAIATTEDLALTNVTLAQDGYQYKLVMTCDDNSCPVESSIVTLNVQNPMYNMVKTVNPTTLSAPGTLTYTFTFSNTGNVTLTNLSVNDASVTVSCPSTSPIASLAPNATATCMATRSVTQAEIDNGADIVNTATSSATGPSGSVSESSTTDNKATATISQSPAFTLAKSAGAVTDANGNGITDAGDTIDYSFTVSNTGNVAVTVTGVTDTKLPNLSCNTLSLAVGASNQTLACSNTTYTLTAADISALSVTNTATASATDPGGSSVTPATASVTTPLTSMPQFALVKIAVFNDSNSNGYAEAGETITYSFTVSNTGNVALTVSGVTDPMLPSLSCAASSLPVGATNQALVCTDNVYTLTAADIGTGQVNNTAMGSATDVNNTAISDVSGTAIDNDTPTTVVLRAEPQKVPSLSLYGLLALLALIIGSVYYRGRTV